MIPSALALLVASAAAAEDEGPPDETDDPLSRHRVPYAELVERTIGSASKSVEFNWRRTRVHVAVAGAQLFELNNFNSLKAGAMARLPTGNTIVELGVSYVQTWDTPSSELLALTPYRQPGRPERMEVDVGLAVPFAEGVVTVAPRWFPSVQLVFNGYAGFRYLLYPDAFEGMKAGEVVGAVLSPALTDAELANLDDRRLASMQVDPGRYGFLVGVGNDIYFRHGFFVSPRAMFSVPILAPVSGSRLLFGGDLSLGVGMAF